MYIHTYIHTHLDYSIPHCVVSYRSICLLILSHSIMLYHITPSPSPPQDELPHDIEGNLPIIKWRILIITIHVFILKGSPRPSPRRLKIIRLYIYIYIYIRTYPYK